MKKVSFFYYAFFLIFLSGLFCPAFGQGKKYTNSIGMEFVLIPSGDFMMGCGGEEDTCTQNELPSHKVVITKAFYMGKFEVTQAQWMVVMGENPSRFQGANQPVENVSWRDARDFIRRLNEMEGRGRYRLPTEAEWEYAARAGSVFAYSFGSDADELAAHAWYDENSGNETQPVGKKRPNRWGLYDMHGNVLEWVQDWYANWYYEESPLHDPKGPGSGENRVLRGGSWSYYAGSCRSARRISSAPDDHNPNYGFRLVFIPE